MCIFKAGYGTVHFNLNILRHGGTHPIHIPFIGLKSLRLKKNLMPLLIGKLYDLIFNGRTVSRSRTLDDSGVHRRPVQICSDNIVSPLISIGQIAWKLLSLKLLLLCGKRKRNYIFITILRLHLVKIYSRGIDSRRSPRLKSYKVNTCFF